MDKQIIIDGCEFQSDCIEYKDISYLKIMPICVIHELSIACHDKVNKCKYYKLYKQLQAKEQECEALRMSENEAREIIAELKAENDTLRQFLSKEPLALQALQSAYSSYKKSADVFYEMVKQYKKTLTEIKDYCNKYPQNSIGFKKYILQKISECEAKDDMENN